MYTDGKRRPESAVDVVDRLGEIDRLGLYLAALLVTLLFCCLPVGAAAKTFTPLTDMAANRYGHSMTLLPNGKVLIAGGYNNSSTLSKAELYDPDTGRIVPVRDMKAARMNHTATLLSNGKVLLLGGRNGTQAVNTAEIYDPASNSFQSVAQSVPGRVGHSATLLPDGKVLIAGGDNENRYVSAAEIFDPATGSIAAAAPVVSERHGHSATLLPNGRVILIGGMKETAYVGTVEIFDPATGAFSAVADAASSRYAHTATLLEDGRLLVVGGRNGSGIVNSAEVFNPQTSSFSAVGSMASERDDHTATLMPDGTVLIAGGRNAKGYLNTAELFFPETGSFVPTANMTSVRDISSAILLPNSKVLVAGGWNGSSASSSAELFDPEIANPKHRLDLSTAGAGRVHVAFSPGRSCSGSCSQFFADGTRVTLTPVMDDASLFLGWSGCDETSGSGCTVTMTENKQVKLLTLAETEDGQASHPVNAKAGPNGSITPAGITMVEPGGSITYTITPDPGYHVSEVVVDGNRELGAITTFTFTNVKKGHIITVAFEPTNAVTITASAGDNGTITPAGAVQVLYGGSQDFTITPSSGFKVADVLVDGVSVGSVNSYSFSSASADHTITASFTPVVYRIEASAGLNGSITPEGSVSVNSGGSVEFSIAPYAGFRIADVVVDGISVGAAPSYSFNSVSADHSITASFVHIIHRISATAGENGTVTPAGVSEVENGSGISYSITPAAGFQVADVLVDGVPAGALTSYSFENVTADHSIAASFSRIVYQISATAGANGSVTPAGVTAVNSGSGQDYQITAAAGFKVAEVLVDGVSVGAVTNYSFSDVSASHTIEAAFTPIVYTVSASAGVNGGISPAGAIGVNHGAAVSFTIIPAAGYKVADVLVDDLSVGPVLSYGFTSVTSDHSISASFTPIVYSISASAGANGSITPSGTSSVNHGQGLDFTITPAAGFKVMELIVDGVPVAPATSYSFANVTSDHSISASFAPIVYTLSASAGANGSVSPAGDSSVNHGESLSYAITPSLGFKVAEVVVDGVSVGAVESYRFESVSAGHSIAASFTPIVFSVAASAGESGSIAPTGAISVNYGDSLSFTVTPATGFKVADLLVDGASVGALTSYSFTGVTADHSIAASFAPVVFTANALAGANGSIVPAGATPVNYGADLTFSITPDTGFKIAEVVVDGVSKGAISSFSATAITADLTIAASFTPILYEISAAAGANGSIGPEGIQSVVHGATLSFSITPAPGFRIADVKVDGVSVGAVTSYSFTDVTANHSIAASFSEILYTVSATAGANGSISPAGENSVIHGAPFNCSITPAPGFQVADVVVDGLSVGGGTSYSFSSVTANHSISASFTPIVYSITASSGANGIITPAGVSSVDHGAGISYAITPAADYQVADVLVDGISVGSVTVYHFSEVTANHTISATFLPIIYSHTITASAGPNGSIEPAGQTAVNRGDMMVYTITPASGCKIGEILVDGVPVGVMTEYVFSDVTADHSISVSFVKAYTITATNTDNGSIDPSGVLTVRSGASQSFIITPAPGYRVFYIMVNGATKAPATSYTFSNVTANQTITPYFAPITHAITSTAGPGGSIMPAGRIEVVQGTDKIYNVVAAPGYHVADLLVDGVSAGALTSYTFTGVTSPHTIEATFAPNPTVTITASASPNGSVTPEGEVAVLEGANKSFSFTPAAGYRVGEVLVDGVSVGAPASYNFVNISGSHTLRVAFIPDVFTVTAVDVAGGSTEPAGVSTLPRGGSITYTIAPDTGYRLSYLMVDGVSKGVLTSYSFTNVTANHSITPVFVPITYSISASAGAHGSISPSGSTVVNHGADRLFTITPAPGYHVEEVLVDGFPAGPVTSYTFTAVTANHSIQASFAENPLVAITASAGVNGSISPAGDVTLLSGMSQTFNFLPAAGYRVADVIVDGVSVGAKGSFTFNSVTAYHTISVSFTPDVYTIVASSTPNGSIEPAGITTVPRGGGQSYTITPADGYKVAYVLVNGSSKGALTSYSFSNVTANQNISVTFTPITHNISVSAGAGGAVRPAGITAVNQGSNFTCSMVPEPGYHVADVQVDGVSAGAVTSYTFDSVMEPHTLYATFAVNPTVTITATAGPNGGISPEGELPVVSGTSKTFTFTPATGYRVADVLVDGVSVGAPFSYTFQAISAVNHSIAVSFTLDNFIITAGAAANGRIEPPGATTVERGGSLTCTIIPDTGYRIANVMVDGLSKGAVTSYTFSNVTANHTIVASFAPITFTISASAGSNGSISPPGTSTVNYGSDKFFTITPVAGYHVADVLVDGASVGSVTSYTFTGITASHTISATFAVNPTVTITASAGANGSISPAGEVQVLSGLSKTFTFTPAIGYRVGEVLVDGVPVGAPSSYTFTNITASHTISVSFIYDTFVLKAVSTANGAITPAGEVIVNRGASQTFVITPNPGYRVQFVMVDSSSKGAITSYTFTNVTANHTITPYFAQITYAITATSGANGSVTPSGVSYVNVGGSKSYSITPAAGYHVHDVQVDGVSVGAVTSYTFSNVTVAHTISASFAANPSVTIIATAGSNGSITPSGAVSLLSGVNKTFTMTPSAGYRVENVAVDGVSMGPIKNYTFVNVTGDHSIEVTFTRDVFTITATSGANGSIQPAGVTTLNRGESITYNVTPDPGYQVLNLQVDGTYKGAISSYTFSDVTGNHSINATFALQ